MDGKQSLTDMCGGRFAVLPAEAADDNELSDGAFRMFAKLCGHAKPNGISELNVKAYAARRGVTARTVQKWKRELELAGRLVQLHQGDKSNGLYRVTRNPAERHAAMIENRPKLAKRQQAKTPHGTQRVVPANCGSQVKSENCWINCRQAAPSRFA